jgi:hypothetical protein
MTHKDRKKWRSFMFWSVGCSLLRDEGITCSLYGLRINNCTFGLNFLYKFLSALKFTNFGHQNPDTDPHWSKNASFRSAMEPLRIHNTGFWVQFRSHFVRSGWFKKRSVLRSQVRPHFVCPEPTFRLEVKEIMIMEFRSGFEMTNSWSEAT